ncbi:MAG: glycoside hydrolase family 127 protein [Sphingobacteriaceae bacterium]|nr:glycoside hydrolase family 127 protein [Sphingobacteriaceae bacterium]
MKKLVFFVVFIFNQFAAYCQQTALTSFPLSSVKLLDGPFKRAQQTDLKYILALEPDRLLAPFLKEAGLEPKAKQYGNWEDTGLDGHIGGHYLSALSLMYAATGDKELLKRLTYMIDWIETCQEKNGNGYVGGIPGGKAMWSDVAGGKINAENFALNKKWVPWYNIHKLYAGLVDAYVLTGNQKAKNVLVKLSDWCLNLTSKLSDEQIQTMLRSEHGGMNEVFADVAEITGDKKYLDLARKFSHQTILQPLLGNKDKLTGLHANTQIPKVIGFMRVAEVSGDQSWANAANFFWETVVQNRTISIGGNSVREHFNPVNNFIPMLESKEGPETCNTYNMLKLSKHLFLNNPQARYLDFYERAMYNHILSSQHPEKGGFVYFTPIRPQHYRVYSKTDQSFWCCVGSGLENHGKYGELIYAHNDKDIFVNLFVSSQLNWKEKSVTLTQKTEFPFKETSQISIAIKKPMTFAINLRHPAWLAGKMIVKVNNVPVSYKMQASSYISINRTWKNSDIVTVSLPMQTVVEPLPDNSSWISFVHGPIVLAAATSQKNMDGLIADDSRMGHIANGPLYSLEDAPIIISAQNNFNPVLESVKGRPLTFKASNLIYQQKYKDLQLVPFFQIHDSRYMLYWPVNTLEKIASSQKLIREQEGVKLSLEAATIDQVAPGEQQPESDHNFQSENSETGIFKDRHWRHAKGWFSYDLKNPLKEAKRLRVAYYGRDSNRNFDIYVNDFLLQTVRLDDSGKDEFIESDYQLPQELVSKFSGKPLKIKFVAHPGSIAGGIYYVRLLK